MHGRTPCRPSRRRLSIEEAFELAVIAKKWADGDRFYRSINDGEPEEL